MKRKIVAKFQEKITIGAMTDKQEKIEEKSFEQTIDELGGIVDDDLSIYGLESFGETGHKKSRW